MKSGKSIGGRPISEITKITGITIHEMIKETYNYLVGCIEGEDWDNAINGLTEFEKYVEMKAGKTGKDTNKLHELFFELNNLLKNPFSLFGYASNTYLKRESCRNALHKIINKIADYGIFIGQTVKWEEKSKGDIFEYIEELNRYLNYTYTSFSNGDATKDEIQELIFQLGQAIDIFPSYSNKGIEEIRKLIVHSISEVQCAINAVPKHGNKEREMIALSKSFTELESLLHDLLIGIKNPKFLEIVIKDIEEENPRKKKEMLDAVHNAFKEAETVDMLKELIREIQDESIP